jgi:hypothetical protein
MKWILTWAIPDQRISEIKAFYQEHEKCPMVLRRKQKNVRGEARDLSKDNFIRAMLYCLCTTRQRSGPNGKVAQFFRRKRFPITERYCRKNQNGLPQMLRRELSRAGIRFNKKIPAYFSENWRRLENNDWGLWRELCNDVPGKRRNAAWEREMAQSIHQEKHERGFKLKGFGPKQSRNLLQLLGFSRHEVPLDSRFMTWLHDYGFPHQLTDSQLQSSVLYEIIEDAIIEIARQVDIYPCLLDAAVFSAEDGDGWTTENLLF